MTLPPVQQGAGRSGRYPEILASLAETVTEILIRKGIEPEIARSTGEETVEHVRKRFGGELVYIPMGLGYDLDQRNREIRRRLAAGEPRDEVRREFNLSDTTMRRIENGDAPRRR
ncbi:MAG: hypothetical protein HYY78_12260 [Betaproteobacteria bacterium]|nr:hypothetical protein [Betaproteobacteria bacterium]